jgi:predicted lipoprotein with Yx(FWY)xxD motif
MSVRRFAAIICGLLAVALTVAATAGAAGASTKISLRSTSSGKILVNSKGFTVYMFTRDSKNTDMCKKDSTCITFWPPVTTTGKVIAGSGIKAGKLGTIAYKGNLKQVTYDGHPLYTFSEDSSPGSTEYINVSASGGRWPALSSGGTPVTK